MDQLDRNDAKKWSESRMRFELDVLEKEYDRLEAFIRSFDDCPHDPPPMQRACGEQNQIRQDIPWLRDLLRSKL